MNSLFVMILSRTMRKKSEIGLFFDYDANGATDSKLYLCGLYTLVIFLCITNNMSLDLVFEKETPHHRVYIIQMLTRGFSYLGNEVTIWTKLCICGHLRACQYSQNGCLANGYVWIRRRIVSIHVRDYTIYGGILLNKQHGPLEVLSYRQVCK